MYINELDFYGVAIDKKTLQQHQLNSVILGPTCIFMKIKIFLFYLRDSDRYLRLLGFNFTFMSTKPMILRGKT